MTGAPTNRNASTMPASAGESAAPLTEHTPEPTIRDVLAAVERMTETLERVCTKIDAIEVDFDEGIEAIRSEMRLGLTSNANGMLNLERSIEGLRTSTTKDVATLFQFRRETRDRFQRISDAAGGGE